MICEGMIDKLVLFDDARSDMLTFPDVSGYSLQALIHEGTYTVLYRAAIAETSTLTIPPDQTSVILKQIKSTAPTLEQMSRLQHEFSITEGLDLAGVVKVYGLDVSSQPWTLVSEDFGGISLKQWLLDRTQDLAQAPSTGIVLAGTGSSHTLTLLEFLHIAIQLTLALRSIHQHHIIHKDIKPANVIIHPVTQIVKLTDFGIASRSLTQTSPDASPNANANANAIAAPSCSILEGTLAYLSPEQTGRVNRSVDYRSDFYALGVLFYELLTGQLPFQGEDPLELVHGHIAKQAPPLQSLNPSLPSAIAQITTQLMAKNAEDRYQSASGLLFDLEYALRDLQTTGKIAPFPVGQRDQEGRLQVPETLYGRDGQFDQLMAAFERMKMGASEGVILQSAVGLGKSALLHEFQQLLQGSNVYLAVGRFDAVTSPHRTLLFAWRGVLQQILTESEAQVDRWREILRSALCDDTGLLVSEMPELEWILGQPIVSRQEPTSTEPNATEPSPTTFAIQNRKAAAFHRLVNALLSTETPVVLILDDVHLIDEAAITGLMAGFSMTPKPIKSKLIKSAIPTNRPHLMVLACQIGQPFAIDSARSDVSSSVGLNIGSSVSSNTGSSIEGTVKETAVLQLLKALSIVKNCGTPVISLSLDSLTVQDVTQLLADTLKCYSRKVTALAQVLYDKTQGNPFLLLQLLNSLPTERLLNYDYGTGKWQWDLLQIRQYHITENGVAALLTRSQTLAAAVQDLLHIAACLGTTFDASVLAALSDRSIDTIPTLLAPAIEHDIVVAVSGEIGDAQSSSLRYKFFDDRLQSALYETLSAPFKHTTHQAAGRYLQRTLTEDQQDERCLEIVYHLNAGWSIEDRANAESQLELAQLNFKAGQQLINVGKLTHALDYFQIGLAVRSRVKLSHSSVAESDCDAITFALNYAIAEVALQLGHWDLALTTLHGTLARVTDPLDRSRLFELQIKLHCNQSQVAEACEVTALALQHLGVEIKVSPTEQSVQHALQSVIVALADRTPASLLTLATMTDPTQLARMRIASAGMTAAYRSGSALFPCLVCLLVETSVKAGNTAMSPYAYATYGNLVSTLLGDRGAAYDLGQVALQLAVNISGNSSDNSPNNSLSMGDRMGHPKTYLMVATHLIHGKSHLRETLPLLLKAHQRAKDSGAGEIVASAVAQYCGYAFWVGRDLMPLLSEVTGYSQPLLRTPHRRLVRICQIVEQTIFNLCGQNASGQNAGGQNAASTQLTGNAFNEVITIPQLQAVNDRNALYWIYAHKLLLQIIFGEFEGAIETGNLAQAYEDGAQGQAIVPIVQVYHTLAMLTQISPNESPNESSNEAFSTTIQQLRDRQTAIHEWASDAPMNYQHHLDLLEAEFCRVLAMPYPAMNYYDRAIEGAIANGYIQDAAIINERAALFYRSIAKPKIAKVYVQDAYQTYQQWGALAKLKQLEAAYPEQFGIPVSLLTRHPHFTDQTLTRTKSSTSAPTAFLDFTTAMKASEAIASELVLDKLLDRFLEIILENSGAQRGYIVLDRSGELYIEGADTTAKSGLLKESELVCIPLIRYVARTRQPLVIDNAMTEVTFALDPYVLRTQPKSILCAPIVYQRKPIGFIYLENNLVTGAFTSDRLELLKILTSQAAIAIENAKLYALECDRVIQIEQSQAQVVQSEKMSALGILVAGVAHEINNPIGFLHGSIKNVRDYMQDLLSHLDQYYQHYPTPIPAIQDHADDIDLEFLKADLPKLLESMRGAADRIKNISTSLRTFSRSDTDDTVCANLHEGMDSTILILKYRLQGNSDRPKITIVTDYGDIPDLMCFPGQLNQVFMNILANAIDAFDEVAQNRSFEMLEQSPQIITIQTEVIQNGEAIEIRIEDNGEGMPESVKARIFDHLFTTKGVGKGTGLGLAIARQIVVEKHGGLLEVHSTVGQGTTFRIEIPILNE